MQTEAVIMKAEATVNKEMVGLPVNNSADVKKCHLFLPIFHLYLIAGRSRYPEGGSNCK
jgi:hypothetical protein